MYFFNSRIIFLCFKIGPTGAGSGGHSWHVWWHLHSSILISSRLCVFLWFLNLYFSDNVVCISFFPEIIFLYFQIGSTGAGCEGHSWHIWCHLHSSILISSRPYIYNWFLNIYFSDYRKCTSLFPEIIFLYFQIGPTGAGSGGHSWHIWCHLDSLILIFPCLHAFLRFVNLYFSDNVICISLVLESYFSVSKLDQLEQVLGVTVDMFGGTCTVPSWYRPACVYFSDS